MTAPAPDRDVLPAALLRPRRRWSYLWLLPLLCAAVAGWLLYGAYLERGIPITIEFRQGHGLKPGDGLRYRGITVGAVAQVRLAQDLNSVEVGLRLDPHARDLARAGSRFWIVRPQLDLEGARGLDTVVGANYVRVLPGQGEPRRSFVGLEEAPLLQDAEPGGLEIVLSTPQKGSLRPGAPVTYRQVAIGAILSVGLAPDAGAVVARAHIQPAYTALIRNNTRFWKTGGARFSAGLTGLSLDVDSVRGLLLGGVSLALPPDPGKPAAPGDVFRLYEEPEHEWLEWTPNLSLHPKGTDAPRLLPAVLNWKHENWLHLAQTAQRRGWVLPVPGGLLGPLDLLTEPAAALPDSVGLKVAEASIPLNPDLTRLSKAIGILPYEHAYPVWTEIRHITTPEDTLIIAGPAMPERFVAATRYRTQDPYWTVDPAATFDPGWHGAAVVAESDGALVGILLVDEDGAKVARLEPLAKFSNTTNLNSFEH